MLNLLGKAPLVNVSLCVGAIDKAMNRKAHLPGLVTFSGPSGFGKSTAAAIATNHFNAVYVRASDSWTRKGTHLAILKEMGIKPAKSLFELAEQVAQELAMSRRPLIIDECDYLVRKGYIEVIRDLYEGSGATIMLIGEENLPKELNKWERMHGRILDFVLAEPASLEDARGLAGLYMDGVEVAEDLLAKVHSLAKGSARRICQNLEKIREEAVENGLSCMDLATWGSRNFITGEAPTRKIEGGKW